MKTIMKSLMKNNNTRPLKLWSSAVQLVLLSLVLLLSQLTLAKDRIQYHVQNFDDSTLKVINDQGVVSQSYQYAPFGQQLQYKKPSNLKNPNAFVGGIQDTGDLVYLKQRHYNPVLGRFYQPDPVTFILKGHGQTNRYQYGWNDTYTFNDPNGRYVVPLLLAFGIWGADNLRSDTPNANNTPPSGVGDAALIGYGFGSMLFTARLASMSTAELTYYNIAQNGASIAPAVWSKNFDLKPAPLTFDASASIWKSPAGLEYGLGSREGNRILHVLEHTIANPNKVNHTLFNVNRNQVLSLVDSAWMMRGNPLANDPGAYVIPMGRAIGTQGEASIKIVVKPNTNKVITAYPVR